MKKDVTFEGDYLMRITNEYIKDQGLDKSTLFPDMSDDEDPKYLLVHWAPYPQMILRYMTGAVKKQVKQDYRRWYIKNLHYDENSITVTIDSKKTKDSVYSV